jgi:hypothetical protein
MVGILANNCNAEQGGDMEMLFQTDDGKKAAGMLRTEYEDTEAVRAGKRDGGKDLASLPELSFTQGLFSTHLGLDIFFLLLPLSFFFFLFFLCQLFLTLFK